MKKKLRSQDSAKAIAKRSATRRARLDPLVRQMHAEYTDGKSLNELARKYGKNRRSIRETFGVRGLHVRPHYSPPAARGNDGRIIPTRRHTDAEIAAMIPTLPRVQIPFALRREWRHWTKERRAWLAKKLWAWWDARHPTCVMPTTPFSKGLEPFDYSSDRAQSIAAEVNKGRNSRSFLLRIQLNSRGVIIEGELWYWVADPALGWGAYYTGIWKPGLGRPSLHHHLWEKFHGRPVPASHVIRFADGNKNNFARSNLVLAHRRAVAVENKASALLRKSRATTSLLLRRFQNSKTPSLQPPTAHAHDQLIGQMGARRHAAAGTVPA